MNDLRQKLLNSFERLEIVANRKSNLELIRAIEAERALIIGLIDESNRPKLFEGISRKRYVN